MATFKVGQRVRVVAFKPGTIDSHEVPIGAEGVVIGAVFPAWEYLVDLSPHMHSTSDLPPTHWGFNSEHLAPLTDGETEQWAADQVRKWTRPEPVVAVPVKVRA